MRSDFEKMNVSSFGSYANLALLPRGVSTTTRTSPSSANGGNLIKFGKAKFSGLTLTNVAFPLTVANGTARLTPSAQLYGGRFAGDIRVAVQGNSANLNVEQTLRIRTGEMGGDAL